jgi:DNA gyrase inhibitor GyrI
MRCAKLARIIGVLLVAAALGACSTIKLAYNNLPELSYWWLDAYLDFDGSQTPKVRDELAQLLSWHRQNELPRVLGVLQEAQALAPREVTAAQACRMADQIRERLLAVTERAEPAGTELALSLTDAQLQQLERKYAKNNAEYRKEWLDRSSAEVQEKRYEKFLDRFEDFYGRLTPEQRELVRQQVAQSVFDPRLAGAERRQRQQEALTLLRGFNAAKPPPAEARAAIHAYVMRIADPPPGPWRDHQQALLQEGCRNLAALHNATSASQREQAVRRLQAYQDDLRQLVAAR